MVASFLIRAGSYAAGGLDGSESDGTQLFAGNAAMTTDWTAVDATFTASAVTAPNGATDAGSLVENTANTRHILYQYSQNIIATDGTVRWSVYAKANGRRYLAMFANAEGNGGDGYAYFDLQTGTVTDSGVTGVAQSTSNVSISVGANGFYKCSADFRMESVINDVYYIFAMSDVGTYGAPLSSNNPSYTGGGSSMIYLWRPKLVQL
jgi:hypothetical protein